jgi:uncharacterized protein
LSFLDDFAAAPDAPWVLRNASNNQVIARIVEGAFERKSRNRGLLGRSSLPVGHALVLAPCNSIHTFFMRFAIDVAFLERDGIIRSVRRSVAPWRLHASLRAFATLECAAGTFDRTDTRAGDRLLFSRE